MTEGQYEVRGGGLGSPQVICARSDRRNPLTWSDVTRLWQSDAGFRSAFAESLVTAPCAAFLWETPPVSAATRERPFEWVVVDERTLARANADPRPFREHIAGRTGVQTFANLSGDAELVVPCDEGDPGAYAHLATFVRGAPETQVHELWRTVGRAVETHLERDDSPVWVSTSGLGVYWIHVRIDARPKYYTHEDYRSFPTPNTPEVDS